MLDQHPDLIRARSVRNHHATLLHHVGANGIEGSRQHTPPNAVEILELLLDAGAEVDASADMYGGRTPLALACLAGLVSAAACHQREAVMFLLDRGVPVDAHGPVSKFTGVNWAALNGDLGLLKPGFAVWWEKQRPRSPGAPARILELLRANEGRRA